MLHLTRSGSPEPTFRRLALAALVLTHLGSCAQLDQELPVTVESVEMSDGGLPNLAQPVRLPLQGYTLYCAPAPNASPDQRATLVDMEGRVVHEWSITGMPVVMIPGGSLLGSQHQRATPGTVYQDAVGLVQESRDGEQEWTFSEWDDDGSGRMMARQHHDLQREGNPVGYYAPGQEMRPRGADGIVIEVTQEKSVVWKHVSRSKDAWGRNYVYRAHRVPPEWLPPGINPGKYPLWSRIFAP